MTDMQLLPVIWILASMVAYVLATLFVGPAQLARLRAAAAGRVLLQAARLIYYLGVPYAALLTRAVAPVDIGLAGISGPILGWTGAAWLHSFSAGVMAGVLVLIPIGIAARQLARAQQPLGVDERSIGLIIVDGIYLESHWAFYRTAPLILLDNAYVATLFGLGLIGVELLVSLVRNGLGQQPEERQSWLETMLLLALSTALFILTRNVWIIIAAHLTVELLLKAWTARLAHPAIPAPPARYEAAPDPDVRPLNEQPLKT